MTVMVSFVTNFFHIIVFTPFPNDILCQAERFSRCQFLKLDENGGNFSKRAENSVGKGKIAWHKLFLLFQ